MSKYEKPVFLAGGGLGWLVLLLCEWIYSETNNMNTVLLKEQLQQEVNLIPEQQLTELLKLVHSFRLSIETTKKADILLQQSTISISSIRDNPAFGVWQDIDESSRDYLQRIRQQQWS